MLVVAGAAAGTWRAWEHAAAGRVPIRDALLAQLARELHSAPALGPRLSVSSDFHPCTPLPALASPLGYERCAAAAPWMPSATLGARVTRAAREKADAASLYAAALVDLHAEPGAVTSLDRAISTLQTVRRMAERPAPVLSDLASAYLVRADRTSDPRDLLEAADLAEEALQHEPRYLPALYNRALALQRFGLVDAAEQGWRAYLHADSTSGWADAAKRGLRRTLAVEALPAPPPEGAPPTAYAAWARADPQGARILGFGELLGAWGGAVLGGDAERARASLHLTGVVGDALERRPGGDATLADAVRAIRSTPAGARLARLARAHREFAAGMALYESVQLEAAVPRFRAAAGAADGSPALLAWSNVMWGVALVQVGKPGQGEPVLRAAIAAADTVRHPALAARARWSLAGSLLRGDRYDSAAEAAREAARFFARTGERENQGSSLDMLCSAQFALHDMDAGYAAASRALALLRPYRGSKRLHNVLGSIADAAAEDGLPRAAVRVRDEAVGAALRTGNATLVAEARLTRATLLASVGELARARRDVEAGRAALAPVTDPVTRSWLEADLALATGATAPAASRPATAAGYDLAARFFNGKGIPYLAFPAVVGAADARLAAGDLAGGEVRMREAFAMLEQRRDSIRMEPRRAAVFDAARAVVDRVVMLQLAANRPGDALAYLDRGRASLAPVGRSGREGLGDPLRARPGEVAVEYALVADTLLVWTVEGRRLELSRTTVDTARLVRTLTHLRSLLEGGAAEAEVREPLALLYDWLLRPVEARLGGAETPLVIVAYGDLARVPFAALRDARRGRYLLEDHPVRFAASLREAARPAPRGTGAAAVFVADPAFAPGENPGLERLAGASAEVRAIAAGYPRSRVVTDRAATAGAFRAALRSAGMVHYAGHAVFDDERPERSYLALAPEPGHPGPGRLTAGELAQLDLSGEPLVVLAACRSASAGRASGFSGLAGALLAAGAGGVIGGTWEVDDALTQPLMIELHRAYRSGGSATAALRAAQLRLLGSADPALRSPSAWAGFRYVGR
nr:CHAT domain-containing protein [Longimicrobium sp.]